MGVRDAGLLAPRGSGPAVHGAAATRRPASADGARRPACRRGRRRPRPGRRDGLRGARAGASDPAAFESEPAAAIEPASADPALIVFTSGTAGSRSRAPRARLPDRPARPGRHWYGARPGDLCCVLGHERPVAAGPQRLRSGLHSAAPPRCCTTPASTSTSASTCSSASSGRPLYVPHRVPRTRSAPSCGSCRRSASACAAGEPLQPEVVRAWQDGVGVSIHDGYGQTETGHLTGMPIGPPVKPGSMGRPLPGFRAWVERASS